VGKLILEVLVASPVRHPLVSMFRHREGGGFTPEVRLSFQTSKEYRELMEKLEFATLGAASLRQSSVTLTYGLLWRLCAVPNLSLTCFLLFGTLFFFDSEASQY
jgi:hypothetical protein